MKKFNEFIYESENFKKLGLEILDFLDKYVYKNPNFDSKYNLQQEQWTSSDASELYIWAMNLLDNKIPKYLPNSSWFSGGYGPEEGKKIHNELLLKIKNLK